MKNFYFTLLCMLCVLQLQAQEQRGTIVSETWIRNYTQAEILQEMDNLGIPAAFLPVRYDVAAYKLIYNTIDVHGNPTIASGVAMIPLNLQENCGAAILSYQHGTITVKEQVPSRLSQEAFIAVGAATDGYVACVADYLGLGDSPGFHPYIHAASEATAVIDMIRATRNYCAANNIPLNEQLFLTGYSQGGHATMATHRAMQLDYSTEFNVTASVPMSGPYDVGGVQTDLLTAAQPYPEPNYLPYIVLAYREAYPDLAATFPSLSDIFISPYDEQIPALFDGLQGSGDINSAMPASSIPADIVRPEVFADFQTNPNHPLRLALDDNNTYTGWIPEAPMKLQFCTNDQSVIYLNAKVAYEHFQSVGFNDIDTLNVNPNLDHYPCAQPSILFAKLWFDQQRSACTGVNDVVGDAGFMRLFPNPVSDYAMLNFTNPNYEAYTLQVADVTGRIVSQINNIRDEQVPVSAHQLPAGLYTLTLSNGQKLMQQKMVVVR
jgi:hypothetical protein